MTSNPELHPVTVDLFSYPNAHLLDAILKTTEAREVHALEDIYDVSGIKLWSAGRPVSTHLIEKLSGRKLRKPIELCIYCKDPVATSGALEVLESLLEKSDSLRRLVSPELDAVVKAFRSAQPNPTELLLITVLRHGNREMHTHAVAVTALALAFGASMGYSPMTLQRLVHAGMLHDVGELYLEVALFEGALTPSIERKIMQHPSLGARAARELARLGSDISQAICQSHERLDGSGYPEAADDATVTSLAKPLLVAESIANLLLYAPDGLARASIATRLVPGEFPRELVSTVHARSRISNFADPLTPAARDAVAHNLTWAQEAYIKIRAILESDPEIHGADDSAALYRRIRNVLSVVWKFISATGAVESLVHDSELHPELAPEECESAAVSGEVTYRLHRLSVELCGVLEGEIPSRDRNRIEQVLSILQAGPAFEVRPK